MGSHRIPKQTPQPLRPSLPKRHAARLARSRKPSMARLSTRLRRPWLRAPRLSHRLAAQRNSFSVLRLMMALAVLISHTVFLATGSFLAEPLVASTGYSLGQYGVQGFFVLSGILVAQSLVSRGDLFDYFRARAMRIFPALIVCVLLTALVVGPALSLMGRSHYFHSFGVVQYIGKTLSLSTGSAQLPGLFVLNPAAGVVNQSLWTLKYEVACYLLLGGLAALIWRLPARRVAVAVAIGLWAATMLTVRPSLVGTDNGFFSVLCYFALFFGTGVTAFLARRQLRLAWQPVALLGGVCAYTIGTDFAEISSALFVAYGLLWLSTLSFGRLRAFANANDYSYGVYIYGYPVTQAILTVWPNVNMFSLLTMTSGITLLLAFLSWEFVERPALSFVHRWRAGRAKMGTADRKLVLEPATEAANLETIDALSLPASPPKHEVRPTTCPVQIDKSRLRARMAVIAAAQQRTAAI